MTIRAVIFAVLALAPLSIFANGGGGSGGGSMEMPRQMSPDDQAKAAYSDGVRAVKGGDKASKDAAEQTDEKKKAKAAERASKQYKKARDYFVTAARIKPQMPEAWNYIGYTSRKLGEYDKALASYEEALRLNPSYADAIEYRGEAYLGLNRLEDAKGAYMTLFRDARPLADQLMAAMQQWVADRRANAGSVSAADLEAFAQWVDERSNIARQTASLATDGPVAHWN